MSNALKNRIHNIYGAAVSAAAVVAGLCLMVACVGICGAGDAPFTPESVAAAFSPIAWPVYICLALVLGGFALDGLLPRESEKLRPQRQIGALLQRLTEKADLSQCDEALFMQIGAALRKCMRIRAWNAAILAALAAIFLAYGLNPGHFSADINASVIRAMYVLLPCLAAALCCYLVLRAKLKRTAEALIGLLKQAPARESGTSPAPAKRNWAPVVQAVVAVAAIAMIAYGAAAGGTADVLTKAVNICTECVGLG